MDVFVEFLNHIILIGASFHHFGQSLIQQLKTHFQAFQILAAKVDFDIPRNLSQQLEGYRITDRSGLKPQTIKSIGRIVEQRCPLINTEVVG